MKPSSLVLGGCYPLDVQRVAVWNQLARNFDDSLYLGELCPLVAGLLKVGFRTMAPHGQPAFVLYVQTAGFLVTFNPHIHALVADGVFLPSGTFQVLPPLPEDTLCQALRRKLLDFLNPSEFME